ncbi:MAG: trypsin-like peptidase domain-containing protein [candidate division Zixibacteria bacterium]|nr:trypsin-like peptidase domain-containing protein [candidate division Zixibacteria bacterium]
MKGDRFLSSAKCWVSPLLFTLLGVAVGLVISGNVSFDNYSYAQTQLARSQAKPSSVYPITAEGKSPFVAVVDAVRDAVVNIKSERQEELDPYHRRWLRFWGFRWDNRREVSMGSGFFFREDGYILTNSHVVTGGENITVTLADGSEVSAQLVGEDRATDLAVLKIQGDGYPHIELGDSDKIKVGEWVVAIGNPFPAQGLDRTVTVGVVSAKGRRGLDFGRDSPEYQDYIQTDAAINPGNSGGPLVDLDGYVVGINAAIASTAGQSAGIGFAVPANLAKTIVNSLLTGGKVTRGWLGVILGDVDADMAEANGLAKPYGVLIRQVLPNSPAEDGTLEEGDIIIEYNGVEVEDSDHFRYLVAGTGEGSTVDVVAQRRGRPVALAVTVGDRDQGLVSIDGHQGGQEDQPGADELWLGLAIDVCTPALADKHGVEYRQGLIVTYVKSGSPADIKGVLPGMVLIQINHCDVSTVADFYQIKEELKDRTKAILFLGYDLRGSIRHFAIKP